MEVIERGRALCAKSLSSLLAYTQVSVHADKMYLSSSSMCKHAFGHHGNQTDLKPPAGISSVTQRSAPTPRGTYSTTTTRAQRDRAHSDPPPRAGGAVYGTVPTPYTGRSVCPRAAYTHPRATARASTHPTHPHVKRQVA